MASNVLQVLESLAQGEIDVDEAARQLAAIAGRTAPGADAVPTAPADASDEPRPAAPPAPPRTATAPTPPVPPAPRRDRTARFEPGWDIRSSELRAALASIGLAVDADHELDALRHHGVTPERIEAYAAAGVRGVTVRDLVRLVDHGVRPAHAGELRRLLPELEIDDLVRFTDHGVRPMLASALRQAWPTIEAREIIDCADHGVDPADIGPLRDTFGEQLRPRDLLDLTIHDASPELVAAAAAHVSAVRPRDVVSMAVHGVRPTDITRFAAAFGPLDPRDVVDAAIHGVDARDASAFAADGRGATLRDMVARAVGSDVDSRMEDFATDDAAGTAGG